MFSHETYFQRRRSLAGVMQTGLILLPGNDETPMNYAGNPYHFRQDSSFLYYIGHDVPGLAAVIDADSGEAFLFGDNFDVDDIIWMGPQETMAEKAEKSGLTGARPMSELAEVIDKAKSAGRQIHYLTQSRDSNKLKIQRLLGIPADDVNSKVSVKLVRNVVEQRNIKTAEEVQEIEKALDISYDVYKLAMRMARPGMIEQEVYGAVEGHILGRGSYVSFPVIFSVHGETLHNHKHANMMKDGDILVLDSGAESPCYYASDITRTFPVNGKFSSEQRDIYQIVLKAQEETIAMYKPGLFNRDIHLHAAKVIASGLKDLGFMKGNVDDAVAAGAHALFFPHGLGHMMGIDVHDMEDLGENYVGYDENVKRSEQFGLAYLRFARELKTGHVFTVEPGCYFIPELMDMWKAENKHTDFINYDKVFTYRNFGGVRIEDDLLVTEDGYRVLGKPIAKTVEEVETWCQA
ncbi:aminopeptidase P family protein [bacterium]|nr:aminopeptidase P family protein [bacterium]